MAKLKRKKFFRCLPPPLEDAKSCYFSAFFANFWSFFRCPLPLENFLPTPLAEALLQSLLRSALLQKSANEP